MRPRSHPPASLRAGGFQGVELENQALRLAVRFADDPQLGRRFLLWLQERLGCQCAGLFALLPDGRTLLLAEAVGYQEGRGRGCVIPFGLGVTGRAIRTGRVQWVPDVGSDPDYLRGHPESVAELAVPLFAGSRLVGVCGLEFATLPDPALAAVATAVIQGVEPALARWLASCSADAHPFPPPPPRRSRTAFLPAQLSSPDRLRTLFQPVVRLADGATVGYEALVRGPEGSELEAPAALFAGAERAGRLVELDLLALRLAMDRFRRQGPPPGLLFLNVERRTLVDGGGRRRLAAILQRHRPFLHRCVLEVTERVSAPGLEEAVAELRSEFPEVRVALDDFGSGGGNADAVLQLRPDFLKLDVHLVQGIGSDFARRSLIDSLRLFAEKTGITLIAEGIEEEGDLEALRSLGVPLGQGFLLGAPALRAPMAAEDGKTCG